MINRFVSKILSLCEVFKWCIKYSVNVSKKYTIIRILIELANPISNTISIYISKEIINTLSNPNYSSNKFYYLKYLLILSIITLLKMILSKLEMYVSSIHSEMLEYNMTRQMVNFNFNADLEYFDNPDFQDKITSTMRDGYALVQAFDSSISSISSMMSVLIVFSILSKVNVIYAIVMIIFSIPSAIALKFYTKGIYKLNIRQTNDRRRISYIQGIASDKKLSQDIRLFGSKKILNEMYNESWQNLFNEKRYILKNKFKVTLFFDILPEIILIILSGIIIFQIIEGSLLIGDYIYITGVLGQLVSSTFLFINSSIRIRENKLRLDNFKSLFKYENKVLDNGNIVLEKVESIEFVNINFRYPLSDKYILKNISLKLNAPDHVVFVGLNGSGKSTLVKLLLRLYDTSEGKILINNVNIKEYTIDSLRNVFSVYFQDMSNFILTLKDNFILTDPFVNADEYKMEEALFYSNFIDFLSMTSNGMDTYISKLFSPQGIVLSGGQSQKIALARSLYRKSEVLILDEVSSSLDPRSENIIFNNLKEISKDKLTILISHRMSNISLADRVIVLENGEILEDGPHCELIKNNKRYAELYRYQQDKLLIDNK